VTPEAIQTAIDIRESGGTWSDVIEATGFNGATLRPHMARHGANVAQKVVPVKLDAKSIVAARKAGMSWYAIALALNVSEAKLRALAAEADPSIASGRFYLTGTGQVAKPAAKQEPTQAKPKRQPATRKPRAKKQEAK
jgi:hypothetical protein